MLAGLGVWEVFWFCFGFVGRLVCGLGFFFFLNSNMICVDLMVSRSYLMYLGLVWFVF